MNVLILEDRDFISDNQARITGRRHIHLATILKVAIGSKLSIGRLNGKLGICCVTKVEGDTTWLAIENLDEPPPPTLPLTLILGLPRPKMLQRTLQTIATMGVEKLCLVHTQRVEKSFWQTPLLQPEAVHEQLLLGLEQGKATQLPQVEYHLRFRSFIEDRLPQLCQSHRRLIAHPGAINSPSARPLEPTLLAVGPEGGFLDREVAEFAAMDFVTIHLGPRILRVETAIPVLLAKLF
jgi:16S rRNA (uracil1498-N3)-methyltransferase